MSYCQNCATLESLLERLEEEKAQLQAKAFDWQEQWKITSNRLFQAEAREAAMRRELECGIQVFQWHDSQKNERGGGPACGIEFTGAIEDFRIALSPDAGRAIPKEKT